jgi:hypothetical protein
MIGWEGGSWFDFVTEPPSPGCGNRAAQGFVQSSRIFFTHPAPVNGYIL